MIWIDLKHKRPTDKDIPNWQPWSQGKWDGWLQTSDQLVAQLAVLNAAGQIAERNALIDAKSAHWAELKPWLLALSEGKCWFSETRDSYSHYDVEHFRPKKEAKALDPAADRDGYWWLAFNYMNFRLCGTVGNRMKGGWFPLQVGSHSSTYEHQCEESESTYLIDPIDKSDVTLLAFDEEGKATPVPGASEWEVERVHQTIKRLKLNEYAPLTEARRKIWQQVDNLVADFRYAKSRCGTGNNPGAKEALKQVCGRIHEMTERTAELSSVARWCLLLRNDAQLSKLIA